jgi:hypothetical protein
MGQHQALDNAAWNAGKPSQCAALITCQGACPHETTQAVLQQPMQLRPPLQM